MSGSEDGDAERVGEELPLKLDDLEVLPVCVSFLLKNIFGIDMVARETRSLFPVMKTSH